MGFQIVDYQGQIIKPYPAGIKVQDLIALRQYINYAGSPTNVGDLRSMQGNRKYFIVEVDLMDIGIRKCLDQLSLIRYNHAVRAAFTHPLYPLSFPLHCLRQQCGITIGQMQDIQRQCLKKTQQESIPALLAYARVKHFGLGFQKMRIHPFLQKSVIRQGEQFL